MPPQDTALTIESGLASAFAFLTPASASWALSYLLDLSPTNALETLSSPRSISAAVAALCVGSAFEVPFPGAANTPATPRGAFDASQAFDGLFTPAFSANGISVGVIVNRVAPSPSPSPRATFSVGRYARSDATGELLAVKRSAAMPGVAHSPVAGDSRIPTVQIMHLRLHGLCHRVRAMYFVDEAAWPAALRPGSAVGFDVATLRRAVVLAARNQETRFCPRCGAPPARDCGCEVAVAMPRYALDFDGNAAAFAMHSGEFMGAAEVFMRKGMRRLELVWYPCDDATAVVGWDGGYLVSPRLMSQMRVEDYSVGAGGDPTACEIAEMLRDFAVQFSIAEQAPMGFVMPAVGGDGGREEKAGEDCRSDGMEGTLSSGSSGRSRSGIGSRSGSGNADTLFDFLDVPLVGDDPAPLTSADNYSLFQLEPAAAGLLTESIMLPASPAGTPFDVLLQGSLPNAATAAGGTVCEDSVLEPVQTGGGVAADLRRRRRGRPATEAERLERERERRKKNRAAAARANARRKLVNDSLKESINLESEKVSALRLREGELYAANQALRLQLLRTDVS